MLYKLKQTGNSATFVRLKPTTMVTQGLPEKAMEQWLADNPFAVLPDEERVLVISQERAFQNLVDILAVDQEGNLVVVEVKRGQAPGDVVAQALEYASDVAGWDYAELNRRAVEYFVRRGLGYDSLLGAFLEVFGVAPGDFAESQFNRDQRVYVVGESIDPKIERAARWLARRGVEIGCVSYGCYQTEDGELFLDFEETVRPPIDGDGTNPNPPKTPSEDELVQTMPIPVRELYGQLRCRVASFGEDVSIGATRLYIKFGAGNNFAEVHRMRDSLRIYIRPEGLDIPERQTQVFRGLTVGRVADSNGWALNYYFRVDSSTDMQVAGMLLRRSYDAVHGRVPATPG
jgi:predicted transport protein